MLVLGTAQDAGLPQIGSQSEGSRRARRDPSYRRLVASLLVVDPSTAGRWLIDCTPDIREQVDRAVEHPRSRLMTGSRPPLFDGILLTHAHMGHYTGLAQLGREAYSAAHVPVYGSRSMIQFLTTNGPWDQLVKLSNIDPRPVEPEQPITLSPNVSVTPFVVPHRGEYTDTFGYIIRGPTRALVYIPDIDKWERWTRSIETLIASVDIALLDGTFFADGEIPGRSMADIPHPFIEESLQRFASLPGSERAKIVFTHLNHTNPAADPQSTATGQIRRAGMAVARDEQVFPL